MNIKRTNLFVLIFTLMLTISPYAEAGRRMGGWGGSTSSILLFGFVLGGGRTDALILSDLYLGNGLYDCVNRAGNADSEGVTFDPNISVPGSVVISDTNLDENGRVSASIFYSDLELAAGLECQNHNWTVENIQIEDFVAELWMYECPLSGCENFEFNIHPDNTDPSFIERTRLTCNLAAGTPFPAPMGTSYICSQTAF